jgi:mannose/fructose/N-acetylgalactosamine-specific phosphotransferase system component IIB
VQVLLVDTKANLYFLGPEMQSMQNEWPDYLEMSSQIGVHENDESPNEKMRRALQFWAAARNKLPNIAKLARYCIIIASSSAAAERVFSVLKASQSLVQMHKALEDYTEIMVQRQYNH